MNKAALYCVAFLLSSPACYRHFDESPDAIAVGDLDNDGDLDILAVGQRGMFTFSNNGDGSFESFKESVGCGVEYRRCTPETLHGLLLLTDLNADDQLDVVAFDQREDARSLKPFLNRGFGSFSDKAGNLMESKVSAVSSGDFDNDGLLDVAATVPASNSLHILTKSDLDNINARFSFTHQEIISEIPTGSTLASLDFDSDGDLDLMMGLTPMRNDGGVFTALDFLRGVGNPAGVVVLDLNQDQRPDLAFSDPLQGVTTFLNDGAGLFTLHQKINFTVAVYVS